MELYQIRTFLVVAQEQNLTRAAERLAISQPAVSGQIKSLEKELGLELFERRHGGMRLSKAGEALVEPARQLAATASGFLARASRMSGKLTGRLKLGVVLHPETIRLGALAQRLLREFPGVDIEIRHRNTVTVVPSLRSHELDASFYIGLDLPADLGSIELRPLAYRIVAAPRWQAHLADAGWEDISRLPWIVTPKGAAFSQLVDGLFSARGLALSSVVEADQELAIISLVEAGVGLSIMREELAVEAAHAGRVVLWHEEKAESALRLLYLKTREQEPLVQAVLRLVAEAWA